MAKKHDTSPGTNGIPKSVRKATKKTKAARLSIAPMYWPSFPDQIKMIACSGLQDNEMADMLGVERGEFRRWKKQYPNFAAAIEEGRSEADARVTMALYQRAVGYSHPEEKIKITDEGEVFRAETIKHYQIGRAHV